MKRCRKLKFKIRLLRVRLCAHGSRVRGCAGRGAGAVISDIEYSREGRGQRTLLDPDPTRAARAPRPAPVSPDHITRRKVKWILNYFI